MLHSSVNPASEGEEPILKPEVIPARSNLLIRIEVRRVKRVEREKVVVLKSAFVEILQLFNGLSVLRSSTLSAPTASSMSRCKANSSEVLVRGYALAWASFQPTTATVTLQFLRKSNVTYRSR